MNLKHTTVDLKIEARHLSNVPIASLVAQALEEFIEARPSSRVGKFETKGGLDISWTVSDMDVDAAGTPLPRACVGAVGLALAAASISGHA